MNIKQKCWALDINSDDEQRLRINIKQFKSVGIINNAITLVVIMNITKKF